MTSRTAQAAVGLLFYAFMLTPGPGRAAEDAPRYAPWTGGDAGEAGDFVASLRALIDRAEKDRAASPDFLRDLRDLAARYDPALRTPVLSDSFADGDYTADPQWTVARGDFFIERGYGLRSIVAVDTRNVASTEQGNQKREAAEQLLGVILNQVLEQKTGGGTAQPAPADALIFTRARATNAFALELEFWTGREDGRLEIGVFQGQQPGPGYRVVLAPQERRAVTITRVGERGDGVVDTSIRQLGLETGKLHRLRWTRGSQGEMVVEVDGERLVRGSDRAFRDTWDGVSIRNDGGDFTIRRIVLRSGD